MDEGAVDYTAGWGVLRSCGALASILGKLIEKMRILRVGSFLVLVLRDGAEGLR